MSDSNVRIDVDEETVLDGLDEKTDEMTELIGHFEKDQSGGGGDLDKHLENWLPDGDEHKGKTHIAPMQAHAKAAMEQLPFVYEMLGINIDGFGDFIRGLNHDHDQYLTSIQGESREQQVKVLMAAAGVHPGEEEMHRALWSRALNGNVGDGDE